MLKLYYCPLCFEKIAVRFEDGKYTGVMFGHRATCLHSEGQVKLTDEQKTWKSGEGEDYARQEKEWQENGKLERLEIPF